MKALIGYGKSYASFGEICQGRLSNQEDFLITLPVNLWSTCELICTEIEGETEIDCPLIKSKLVAEKMVEIMDLTNGYYIKIIFTRNIPIGKGLSSSTADMLSVARAFQEVFGVIVTEPFISNLFTEIESHDALHYYMSVVYNHRKGRILEKLNHIPLYKIIAIDEGSVIDTIEYNKKLKFTPKHLNQYDQIYRDIIDAFERKDDVRIAELTTLSAKFHAKRTNNDFIKVIHDYSKKLENCMGIITAHSGSFVGLLFPYDFSDDELKNQSQKISITFDKEIIVLKSLRLI